MRIAAIGDAHLGRTATSATSADGVNQREVDFEDSFLRATEEALATNPELMVWLGDVFDHPRPNYRSFRVAMRALRMIRDAGVGLVAISGNHDTPRLPGVGNPYAVLGDAYPEFHFAYRMDYEAVDLPGLRVHLVPQTRTAEDAVDALHRADAERSGDRVNLLITHPLVQSVERRYADMNEIEINDDELRSDLVLLGHYHTFQQLPQRNNVWYAGSTDTFSFSDEPGTAKGFVVLDTDSGVCRHHGLSGQRELHAVPMVDAWGRSPSEIELDVCERLSALPHGSVARVDIDGIDADVYRMLDLAAINAAGSHLLSTKLAPVFRSTTNPVEDMPELATIGARWRRYVSEQQLEQFDVERLSLAGQHYLEQAIESHAEPRPE
jgi:DNA repair exonuclease SbcCD nuclease subunit